MAEDHQWTSEGFPRSIKVSLSIVDLYPNLIALKNPRQLKYNIGLTSFIETMAGLRYDQLNLYKRTKMSLKKVRNRLNEALTFNNLHNAGLDAQYQAKATGANFLR